MRTAGHAAEIVAGAKSQFDVVADGATIFSKQGVGRFPDPAEVLELLRE